MATYRKPGTPRTPIGTYEPMRLLQVEVTQGVRTLAHAEAEIRDLIEKRKIDQETIARLALENMELSQAFQALPQTTVPQLMTQVIDLKKRIRALESVARLRRT